MRKLHVLFTFALLMFSLQTFAQRKVSGTVTSADDNEPLPGVSVLVKGTTTGTITDFDGMYELTAPGESSVLVFSFVGFDTKEVTVGVNMVLNVALSAGVELEEVVVTALGVSREKKTLGYSVTQVDGSELTRTKTSGALEAISGKVAGVNISNTSSQPGASTKIIIRGYNTLSAGGGGPLIVIDGVPVNNALAGRSATLDASVDYGNQVNDINPEDIESISILKGSAATVLYGTRGSKGVVLIKTKKGSQSAGKIKVDFTTAYTASQVGRLPRLQDEFGQGWSGQFAFEENGSWGPRYDGETRLWGNTVELSQKKKPFVFLEDNVRDFFDVGHQFDNTIGISGGNDQFTYRFSYGNTYSNGIITTNVDSYKRNTLSFNGTAKFGKFTIGTSVQYLNRKVSAVSTGQSEDEGNGSTLWSEILQMPNDIPILEFKDYKNKFNTVDNFFTPYAQNPYWAIYENGNLYDESRVVGGVDLGVEIVEGLNLNWKVGADITSGFSKDWGNRVDPTKGSPNGGGGVATQNPVAGAVREGSDNFRQLNSDATLSFNKNITDNFSLDLLVGHNMNTSNSRSMAARIQGITIPGYYELSNSANDPVVGEADAQVRRFGVYGAATVGFKNFLYVGLQARNDWTSTLVGTSDNSYAYQGYTLSTIWSELMKKQDKVSLLKTRLSYATTGGEPGPYVIKATYTQAGAVAGGFGTIDFPFGDVNAFELSDQIGNPGLRPEFTQEFEAGLEADFFRGRIGWDLTYYHKITTDLIAGAQLAPSTGFLSQVVNLGKIRNTGVELLVKTEPVRMKNFSLDASYTFTKNNNKVLELNKELGVSSITIYGLGGGVTLEAQEGQPLGMFKGPVPLLDEMGHQVVSPSTGQPLADPEFDNYGDMNYDYTMGLQLGVSFYGVRVAATADYRKGGLMYSRTADLLYFTGNYWYTTYNDRNAFIVPNSVTDYDGDGTYEENETPVVASDYYSYYSTGSPLTDRANVIDKTYFKLRDVSVSYTLPSKCSDKFKCDALTISAYGRNLLLWTPNTNLVVDPEQTTFGVGLRSEFGEFGQLPTTRNYGVSVKANF